MLENLNLVTMLLVVVVGGALFGVTWYSVCRSAGGESPPRDTPKCHQKIDSETSGNNSRSARKNTAAVSARQTRSQITSCDARNGIFPPRSCVTERLHYCSEAIWGQISDYERSTSP